MPDFDVIEQGKQGRAMNAGDLSGGDPAISPAGRGAPSYLGSLLRRQLLHPRCAPQRARLGRGVRGAYDLPSSSSPPMLILATLTAAPITSTGRRWPWGPFGIASSSTWR